MTTKIRIVFKIGIAVLMLLSIVSCTSSKRKTQSEVLQAMNIDQVAFSEMSVCQQIRIYTDFGMHFLDEGHELALVPIWMDDAISKQPENDVANCISQEGLYRLSLLAAGLNSNQDVSLAVHALIYKAVQLKLIDNEPMQSFLNSAVCSSDLDYELDLTLTYYISKYGKAPEYLMQSDATKKMQVELCKK